ncbi:MAG: serine/threonine-protein kinase [Pseudomonadota bacterium]
MTSAARSSSVLDICDKALAMEESERPRFVESACGADTALRRSVESILLAVSTSEETFLNEDATAELKAGDTIGPYRLEKLLGEGGMGSVFLAERQHDGYTQQVALKHVRGRFLDPDLQRRFIDEQRILATMNHPYIAALIDGGTTADGTPYLVMEYIDGEPIDEYCDRLQLAHPDRIKLLQKVAVAVHYAHQNLVIHRDLKPSNVLVTTDGIPKLLDFGIAKLIDTEHNETSGTTTVFGRGALTPDYASPEQVLDNRVTTASDVYSLGILAYQLLVGERPYHLGTGVHRELIKAVESLTIPRPRTRFDAIVDPDRRQAIARDRNTSVDRLRQRLAGDLNNVLMKALDTDPARRYSSILSFSADLDRYLAGQPVEARPDSLTYRVRRFVGRHRIGVATSAAGFIGLAVSLALISQAYLQAEAAQAEASQRFDQVREIAKTLMFDVYDEIENIPGSASARKMLAATAQRYLETLSQGQAVPVDVRYDAAVGYARLAGILDTEAVESSVVRDNVATARQQAERLFTELLDQHPEPGRIYTELGRLHSRHANSITYISNDVDAARAALEKAIVAFDEADRLLGGPAEVVALRLDARQNYADTYKWQNDFDQGLVLANALIQDIETLLNSQPDEKEFVFAYADALELRGQLHYFNDDHDAAIADYDRSIAAYKTLQHHNDIKEKVDDGLVVVGWSLGNTLVEIDRADDAVASFDPIIDILELRLSRDPSDIKSQRTLAIVQGSLALAIVRQGDVSRAMQVMLQSNAWFEKQVIDDPDTPGLQRSVPLQYEMTGDLLSYADQSAEACQWYQRALDKWADIEATIGLSEFDQDLPDLLRETLQSCH